MLSGDMYCHEIGYINISVRHYEIEYFKIEVHNPYHEDLIEPNPRISSFFKLEDVYCLTECLC